MNQEDIRQLDALSLRELTADAHAAIERRLCQLPLEEADAARIRSISSLNLLVLSTHHAILEWFGAMRLHAEKGLSAQGRDKLMTDAWSKLELHIVELDMLFPAEPDPTLFNQVREALRTAMSECQERLAHAGPEAVLVEEQQLLEPLARALEQVLLHNRQLKRELFPSRESS